MTVKIVFVAIAMIGLCACQSQPDTQKICTPLVLDEITAQNYRANLAAESEAQAHVIWAERTATGANAIMQSVSFLVVMVTLWLSRQFWYFERYIKR